MLKVPSKIKNKKQSLTPSTAFSNAIDLIANIDKDIELEEDVVTIIPTGVYLNMLDPTLLKSLKDDELLAAMVLPRSGLASKHGITLANTPGLIDADYQGEIKLAVVKQPYGQSSFKDKAIIKPNERIAQLLFLITKRVELKPVKAFKNITDRAENGFGSTGTN